MSRQRQKPIRRRGPPAPAPPPRTPAASPAPTASAPRRPATPAARVPRVGWRGTVDSFGGFLTIGSILAAVIVVLVIIVLNRPEQAAAPSDDPLRGEAIDIGVEAPHIADPSQVIIPAGQPPVGGPHFAVPQDRGIYEAPVPDGNMIHSLEHGMVWISYRPDRLDAQAVERLRDIAKDCEADVILSPRPENEMPVALASWGRLQRLDGADQTQIEQFIKTNRNRSPEPGARGGGNRTTR